MKKLIVCLAVGLLCAGWLAGCKSPSTATRVDRNTLIARGQAAPLDLTANYTTPVSYFDQITQFPAWKTVPRGPQFFAGVPLDIEGMICLWGGGNTEKLHIVFPKARLDIPINRKFETLYVYHGCFFKSPDGTPVCAVVFRYKDDSSVTNQLLYGVDMVDWIANPGQPVIGPTGPHSTLAWVGGSFSLTQKEPLRLCLTALKNPHPSLEVKTVDLFSCMSRTAPCIMAMTPGKSGLMQRFDQ